METGSLAGKLSANASSNCFWIFSSRVALPGGRAPGWGFGASGGLDDSVMAHLPQAIVLIE